MKLVANMYSAKLTDFKAIPGDPWVYWITPSLRQLFEALPKLADVAQPRQGLATADNFRFLRFWWEVGRTHVGFNCRSQEECAERQEKWYPYMKGGAFRRWYGNQEYVINWLNNGQELNAFDKAVIRNSGFYFYKGVTYSFLTSAKFNARLSPGGFIFDVAGSSLFPKDIPLVLAVMNSKFASYALKLLNPTVNFQVGDIARLPVPTQSSETLERLVEQAIQIAKLDSAETETTYDFVAPLWSGSLALTLEGLQQQQAQLTLVEQQIDEEVYRLYGISTEDQAEIEATLQSGVMDLEGETDSEAESTDDADTLPTSSLSSTELAQRWISYAVGIVLGRFQPGIPEASGYGRFEPNIAIQLCQLADEDCIATLETNHPDDLATKVEQALELMLGEPGAREVLQAVLGNRGEPADLLRAYLAQNFFKQHVQQYRKRPVYWLLQSPKKLYSLYLFHERISPDTLALIRGNRYLASKINQTQLAITEVQGRIPAAQGKQKRDLEKELERLMTLQSDLEAFDRAIGSVLTARNERGETVGWRLEIDDGIILNLAPLYELMPAWKTEPKKYWDKLQAGDYDWSYTAMRYYPDRVTSKCQKNRSYAIAHGLEDEFESQD
ncbi:MAG: hypothetical protein NW224_15560 [Leptolyngbyaceae cyanobacterium bins.302]|nr:hypothetical protein [Leptolyngbyaceae cyanobacterium bins.302]